ncbi:MAG: hypothetical protein ACPGN4_02945, partial [Miltoncostaeaceae bacterium]
TALHTVGPGTPIYHPPEVLQGEYSAAIDVFSLGLVVLEIALGESVHAGDLQMPPGVTMVTEPEFGIASVTITRASLVEEDEAVEGEEGVEGAEGEEGAAPSEDGEAAETEGE